MRKKKCKSFQTPQFRPCISLREICGTWTSFCGSPDLRIFHDGSRYRLQFLYRQDTAFTVPLYLGQGITFFYFYGIVCITYDDERDLLRLTTEGKYKRVYNEIYPENQ